MPIASSLIPFGWGGSGDEGGGGGGGDPLAVVVAPSDTTQSKGSGASLDAKTFGAFTDDDSRIDNYLAETITVSGTCTWSGSGLGPYTPTDADGDVGVLLLHARDSDNNILATATHSYFRASDAAPSGGPTTLLDFSACDDYDFLTEGGTSGSGGAGSHTLSDGTVWVLDRTGTGCTILRIVSGELEFSSPDSDNYDIIRTDLGTDEWSTKFVRGVLTAQADSTTNSLLIKTSESDAFTFHLSYDHQISTVYTGDASSQELRYRFANSGSTFNNYHQVHGMDLSMSSSVRFMTDEGNMGVISGAENGSTMPTWDEPDMGSMNADVRNATDSWRRYLFIFARDRHLKIKLNITHNR